MLPVLPNTRVQMCQLSHGVRHEGAVVGSCKQLEGASI